MTKPKKKNKTKNMINTSYFEDGNEGKFDHATNCLAHRWTVANTQNHIFLFKKFI